MSVARNLLLTGGIVHPFEAVAPAMSGVLRRHRGREACVERRSSPRRSYGEYLFLARRRPVAAGVRLHEPFAARREYADSTIVVWIFA